MFNFVRRAAAVTLMLAGGASAAAPPHTPQQWRQAAIADIEAAYQITLDNHPGTHDPANPAFRTNLAKARSVGLALAARVRNGAGYRAALQRFNTQIHDGHAGVAVGAIDKLPLRWPGFVAAWRGDGMLVYKSEPGGPPAGARIDSCDGLSMTQLAERNVFAFERRIEERGHWWVYGRDVFIDKGNPFIKLPARCRFTLNDQQTELPLAWRPLTEQATLWRNVNYNGPTLPVGLTEPRAKLYWVSMPTFQPDERQRDAYRAMTSEVRDHRQRYLDADAVVIDLRDNQGGSSAWSLEFAQALWGADRVTSSINARSAREHVWWRASPANIAYVTELVGLLRQEKQESVALEVGLVAEGMQAALTRGEKFYVEQDPAAGGGQDAGAGKQPDGPPAFTAPVYVVVPGQCASACLDALDYFTMFPNTKLIGAPSAADSTYMEVRTQDLASGLAKVIIPNKVYVGRARAAGQFYSPAIYVNDVEWSQPVFLKAIEADLAGR
ncbi:MAG: S41 family peptidase [Pseudomonadota bacterium]